MWAIIVFIIILFVVTCLDARDIGSLIIVFGIALESVNSFVLMPTEGMT